MCAKLAASPTRIFLDEYDLSGSLNSTSLDISQETPPTTCFSDAGPRRVVGNYDYKQSHKGLLEPTDDGFDEIIFALLSDADDHYLTQLFGANAAGGIAYDSIVRNSGQPRSAAVGGAILLDFDTEGSGGIARGLVLANKTTTGAENLTGYNAGVKGSGSTYAVTFRVLTFSGTNITLVVQESQNDGDPDAYASVAGLTSGALTGIGCVRVTTTAALEAWRRVVVSGTFSSAAILVTAGVVQGTG